MTEEHVVLLGPGGEAIGTCDKSDVHRATTPLHLAFSLHLFDGVGRVLLTRRALSKATWPGVWTNSCCGHPGAGESLPDAIFRRVRHELATDVTDLRCVLPHFAYSARDANGIQENEICPVYVGRLMHPQSSLEPNRAEVMDWVWMNWTDLVAAVAVAPFAFSPWAVEQIRLLPTSPSAWTSPSA
jgi:isopentenyl-diphosphate Delta-isomerase